MTGLCDTVAALPLMTPDLLSRFICRRAAERVGHALRGFAAKLWGMKHHLLAAVVLFYVVVVPARAWHFEGHTLAAKGAALLLPEDVPAFLREGGKAIAHHAIDPDLAKHPMARQLRDREYADHYLDIEFLGEHEPPALRSQFIQLCQKLDLDPNKVGLLPYAVAESTQKLAIALAEHRRHPDHPEIRAKCLVIAGTIAHYAADLCQPLHVTIHYDGRAGEDGKSPRSGIHDRMDDLLRHISLKDLNRQPGELLPLKDLMPEVMAAIRTSLALVDKVYELESQLPPKRGDTGPNESPLAELTTPVRELAVDRLNASSQLIARLYITAWRMSEQIMLPPWLDRETMEAME